MAESSILWTTGTTGDGSASGYTETQAALLFATLFTHGTAGNNGAVLSPVLLDLIASGVASPIHVDTGAAIVNGYPYFNSTPGVDLAVSTPAGAVTGGRVVLRITYGTTRTVRLATILNTSGNAAIPAMVQSAGTAWDIPIATFTITNLGVIALTDAREFCYFSTQVSGGMIDSGGIDYTHIGEGTPILTERQGGHATQWDVAGTTSYDTAEVDTQVGSTAWTGAAATGGTLTITFPHAWPEGEPIVLASPNALVTTMINAITTTQVVIQWDDPRNTTHTAITFHWIATGSRVVAP